MTTTPDVPEHAVTVVPPGTVVYGMQLPIQSQSTLYTAEWETRSGPDELAAVAAACDEAGFFYVAVCDHTAIPTRAAEAMSTTWYDTVATLGWLAARTRRVRLLSHVLILAQRHPLRAAKELSTLDFLSGGRLIVGVGAGHVAEEFEALGADFAHRGRDTDEAVLALARSFTAEFPDLPGPKWAVSGLGIRPRPVQQPRPPIWIGGSSRAALRRTAALGDGWLPQGTPRAELGGQIAELRRLRDELRGGAPLDIGTIVEPICLTGPGTGVPADRKVPGWALSGGPEQVAASLRELAAMGVNHLQVRFLSRSVEECCDQARAFGELVGPLLGG